MFITLNRIDTRYQQDFMQSKQAGLMPAYMPERSGIIIGSLIYQDLSASPGFNNFTDGISRWISNGGSARPKIVTSKIDLNDGEPSQVGGFYDYYMVRMQGYIKLEVSGTWELLANQDDYLAVNLDGVQGYHGGSSGSVTNIATVNVTSGGWKQFDMIFQENGGNQYYHFYLKRPGESEYTELSTNQVGYSPLSLTSDYTY